MQDWKHHEPPHPEPALLAQHEDLLKANSTFGFLGFGHPHNTMRVALTSCLGRWDGCIPDGAAAIVWHHGHRAHEDYYGEGLSAAIQLWYDIFRIRHRHKLGSEVCSFYSKNGELHQHSSCL